MSDRSWISFVAARYLSARKRDKASPSSVFSIVGIGVGVMALIIVLAVMNGFQLGFIESILEISSYHIRLDAGRKDTYDLELKRALSDDRRVSAVLPFVELQALASGRSGSQELASVRGVPAASAKADSGLMEKLVFEEGAFDLEADSAIVGAELARLLGLGVGDYINLVALSGAALSGTSGGSNLYRIAGLFRSGFYEYDLSMVFIDIDEAFAVAGGEAPLLYGIKLKDRWKDLEVMGALKEQFTDFKIESWREYNRSFFGALRTEKVIMFLLVGLIFLIVAVNVYQAQRRVVLERRDEIGLLRAVGAKALAVRLVFTTDGLVIGLIGALCGLIPGLLIALNIEGFFTLLESVVNGFIGFLGLLFRFFGFGEGLEYFTVFSPTVFYIKEIPAKLIPSEVFLVFLFGCLSATSAAWFASAKATRIRPAEVLRDE